MQFFQLIRRMLFDTRYYRKLLPVRLRQRTRRCDDNLVVREILEDSIDQEQDDPDSDSQPEAGKGDPTNISAVRLVPYRIGSQVRHESQNATVSRGAP